MKGIKLSALFLLLGLGGLHAQKTVTTSGGEGSGTGGSVSYSVGQLVYTTNTGTNGSLAQGVQQPYEISIVSGLEEAEGIDIEYMIYPNPTTDVLNLKVKNYHKENLSYQLYDMSGKLLENKKLAGNSNTITMANLAPASYLLKVTANNKELKTFKIIKY